MGPLPRPGRWHELRIPVAWTPLQWSPIQAIDFEHYGGRVFWDRTAVVKDGREHILIEDTKPMGSTRGSTWEWVDKPVKSGKKAHTQAVPPRYGSHGVHYMKERIVQHMPSERARALSVLQEHIPKLGPTAASWGFFEVVKRIEDPDARRRIQLYTWFLKAIPDHPKGVSALKGLLSGYKAIKDPDPVGSVAAVMRECGVPRKTRYAFYTKYTRGEGTFIRTWLVLGPFPNSAQYPENAPSYPPESERVDLRKEYEGARGRARWKVHKSEGDLVDLAKIFTPNENVIGYAVCWVHSDRVRAAVLEVGSDDGCKLWVNRKLVLDRLALRSAAPRQDIVPIHLARGWNELFVKVEQGPKDWGFYAELVNHEGRGLLKDVKISTTPPPARRQ